MQHKLKNFSRNVFTELTSSFFSLVCQKHNLANITSYILMCSLLNIGYQTEEAKLDLRLGKADHVIKLGHNY